MVPLKYLSDFWRSNENQLINCEISLTLTWSDKYFLVAENGKDQGPTFTITDTKLYIPTITLWTQDNVKLLK